MGNVEYKKRRLFFAERIYFYQTALCLHDYQLVIHEEDINSRAEYVGNECGKIVSVSFDRAWMKRSSTSYTEIDKVAFHETFEIGFIKIRLALLDRCSVDFTQSLIHEQVRRAEHYLWPLLREKLDIGDLNFSPAINIKDICRFDPLEENKN